MVYNQLDSIESHCRSAKAIACWLEYVHNRLHRGVINKRYELKFQIRTLRSALLYWKDYALSKATLRRRLRVFRQLHPPRSGSTSDISCIRSAFLVWSQDFVQSRRRDSYLSDILRVSTKRCKTKSFLELWEDEWGRKLERRLSLYRVFVRLDSAVATAHYLRQFIRNGLKLPEERKRGKSIYEKRISSGISSPTEDVISSRMICVSPPGYEMSIAGRRTLHHFLEIAYVQSRGLRRLFRRWRRLTAAHKFQMTKSQEETLLDVQSIDRTASGVQSIDRMESMADAFVAARLTRLIRNCLTVWAATASNRRKSLRRLSVRCLAQGPFRHWMLLLSDIYVRRFRDSPMQDVSFFSKAVAIASSEIMRKDLRQMELRTLKAKRQNNLRSAGTNGIDGFSSVKKRCSTDKSRDCVTEKADTSHITNTLDSSKSRKNRSSSRYTTVNHTPLVTVPDFPAMSSASIKNLWGSVVIDDCSQSTYLGQHAKKKIIKKSI
jgi:hypothetical protein